MLNFRGNLCIKAADYKSKLLAHLSGSPAKFNSQMKHTELHLQSSNCMSLYEFVSSCVVGVANLKKSCITVIWAVPHSLATKLRVGLRPDLAQLDGEEVASLWMREHIMTCHDEGTRSV